MDQQDNRVELMFEYLLDEYGYIPNEVLDSVCYAFGYTYGGVQELLNMALKEKDERNKKKW